MTFSPTSDESAPAPGYPTTRMRRLRYDARVRELVRGVRLSPAALIQPLFVRRGRGIKQEIGSMPGQHQWSIDLFAEEVVRLSKLRLGGVILFGIPDKKDLLGSDACSDGGIIQDAVRAAKAAAPNLLVMTDVCFCEYTDHGHCGVLTQRQGNVDVDNDATLELLARQAVSHARAGSDLIAPSGMMDGMVGAIRRGLDAEGFSHLPIMSYAAKYASAFYGPFRDAAESAPQVGDRRAYQMDPAAAVGQALREAQLDLAEGADMIMVKPALAYLDVIAAVRRQFLGVPLAAYNVSGEYSMVKAAAARGWLDERQTALESLTAMHRAGAEIILTYWAQDAAKWLSGDAE